MDSQCYRISISRNTVKFGRFWTLTFGCWVLFSVVAIDGSFGAYNGSLNVVNLHFSLPINFSLLELSIISGKFVWLLCTYFSHGHYWLHFVHFFYWNDNTFGVVFFYWKMWIFNLVKRKVFIKFLMKNVGLRQLRKVRVVFNFSVLDMSKEREG